MWKREKQEGPNQNKNPSSYLSREFFASPIIPISNETNHANSDEHRKAQNSKEHIVRVSCIYVIIGYYPSDIDRENACMRLLEHFVRPRISLLLTEKHLDGHNNHGYDCQEKNSFI